MGHITVIARVARDLWQRKQTLSSGSALGLGSFTAINPWPRAITITYMYWVVFILEVFSSAGVSGAC